MRPEVSSPLTLKEHRELSRELRAARARLRELSNVVVAVYGPNNRAAFSFLKIADAMDRLCQDLQVQVSQDYPGRNVDGLYL
ncbi:MAG: hypothetical protein ABSG26_25930 [Bryobacteraceae bacterium]|jgi:hypothetical protein